MSSSESRNGVSVTTVLFLIFLVLKICDVVDWSWWWITAPLWIPIAIAILLAPFIDND